MPQGTADVAAVKQRVTIIKRQICSRDFMTQDKVRVPDNRYALLFIWGEVEMRFYILYMPEKGILFVRQRSFCWTDAGMHIIRHKSTHGTRDRRSFGDACKAGSGIWRIQAFCSMLSDYIDVGLYS